MTRLVLVHGAWHGGWAWEPVRAALAAAGHDVVAVDLPGSDGDLSATLSDQAAAVAAALEPGSGSVLVAHSHGGLVAQEATALAPNRVLGIIGVDAWFAPGPGSFLDVVPGWMSDLVRASVVTDGAHRFVPVPPAAMFGVEDPTLATRIEALLTPQPYETFAQSGQGFSFSAASIPGIAIVCEPRSLPFDELAAGQRFPVWPITSGHDVMALEPAAIADLLVRAVETIAPADVVVR
jgi:pimeloyl-ACP methyl ester carboxylesterase